MASARIVSAIGVCAGMVLRDKGILRSIAVTSSTRSPMSSGSAATSGIRSPPTERSATVQIMTASGRRLARIELRLASRSLKYAATLTRRSRGWAPSRSHVRRSWRERSRSGATAARAPRHDPPRLAVSIPRIEEIWSTDSPCPISGRLIHRSGRYEAWPYATVVWLSPYGGDVTIRSGVAGIGAVASATRSSQRPAYRPARIRPRSANSSSCFRKNRTFRMATSSNNAIGSGRVAISAGGRRCNFAVEVRELLVSRIVSASATHQNLRVRALSPLPIALRRRDKPSCTWRSNHLSLFGKRASIRSDVSPNAARRSRRRSASRTSGSIQSAFARHTRMASGLISLPMKSRPASIVSVITVPDPTNGSDTSRIDGSQRIHILISSR